MIQNMIQKIKIFNFYDYFRGLGIKITPDSDFSSNFTPKGVIFIKKLKIFFKFLKKPDFTH